MQQLNTQEYVGHGAYRFTKLDEFGFTFEDFITGVQVPEQGAHINLHASGRFRGARLDAEMQLTDYVRLLPNGRIELNVFGVLTDDAGRRVYFHSTGVAEPREDGLLQLAENIYMHSNHEAYAWMNTKQFWANGVVDPRDMSLRVTLFCA